MANHCPKCNGLLNESDYCENCLIEFETYKKIREASQILYNKGLQKARNRDLTGSIEDLKRSIQFDKYNSDARNLLGLVYFEMGEAVLALQQWVISQHLEPTSNLASQYLKDIQDNQFTLDMLNSVIKKYNQALAYINQNSNDLAKIQLKKIISSSPNFVKAYILLALVYMKENELGKAKNELIRVLNIDKGNYVARKYYNEIANTSEVGIAVSPEKEMAKEREKVKRQIAINHSVQQFLGVVFGLAIGAALILFLIMPSRIAVKESEVEELRTTLREAEEDVSVLEASDTENKATIEEIQTELSQLLDENNRLQNKDEKVQMLMLSVNDYLDNDIIGAANTLSTLSIEDSLDGVLNGIYEKLKANVYPTAATTGYVEGYTAYNAGNYTEGINYLETTINLIDYLEGNQDRAYYYLGRCYQLDGQSDKAISTYQEMLDKYPASGIRSWAIQRINELGGTVNN